MRTTTALGLALSAAVLLGACGGSDELSRTSAASDRAVAGGGGTAQAPAALANARTAPVERSVVRTAELGVQVRDVREGAARARTAVEATGGEVAGEDASGAGATTLRLKVPEARFDAFLDELARLGDQQYRRVSSEDVTEQVVDLDSRISTQTTSVARVRALLAKATSIGEVVQVEGELAKREAELESLQARLRSLADRAALSTVTLQLSQDRVDAGAGPAGFLDGLGGGWDALVASARVAAVVVGAALPFLPVPLAVWFVLRLRTRRRAAEPATP